MTQQGLPQYAESLSELHTQTYSAEVRKSKGQFFTPKKVGMYMSSLFQVNHETIRVLDPGAGTGILTAAFCERLLHSDGAARLTLDVYENDPVLLPLLKSTLEKCKSELEGKGHTVEYHLHEKDFILSNEQYLRQPDLFSAADRHMLYDFVIANPPYYKLNKSSPEAAVMAQCVSEQPNIYSLFMALSLMMTRPEGEMVFITPRSFCSGLYYKKFREWFLENAVLMNIHIFESRKKVFDSDDVLQENVIIRAKKRRSTNERGEVTVGVSEDRRLDRLASMKVETADIIHRTNGEVYIRIPTSPFDVNVLHLIDRWPNTLRDLGLAISTGPVVPFRATQHLLANPADRSQAVPLLWMHNMQGVRVAWPRKNIKKPPAIRLCSETMPLLVPVRNYALVKRFSSKEQKRRLHAAVLLESDFPYQHVGIENHVNYIHRPKGTLSVNEAFGIAGLLNTTLVDNYFRSLNGNTQVNAVDMRNLPLPSIEQIDEIGEVVRESCSCQKQIDLEDTVNGILGIGTQGR